MLWWNRRLVPSSWPWKIESQSLSTMSGSCKLDLDPEWRTRNSNQRKALYNSAGSHSKSRLNQANFFYFSFGWDVKAVFISQPLENLWRANKVVKHRDKELLPPFMWSERRRQQQKGWKTHHRFEVLPESLLAFLWPTQRPGGLALINLAGRR